MKYFCSMAYLGKEGRGRKKERENPLAVAGARKLKSIPDIPCFKDLGINAEYYGWVGIAAPKKLPRPLSKS